MAPAGFGVEVFKLVVGQAKRAAEPVGMWAKAGKRWASRVGKLGADIVRPRLVHPTCPGPSAASRPVGVADRPYVHRLGGSRVAALFLPPLGGHFC